MKRKLLVTTMILSMVLSSAMTAGAAESYTTPSTEEHSVEATEIETAGTVNVSCSCGQNSNDNSSCVESVTQSEEPAPQPTYEELHSAYANEMLSVAGAGVRTSIAGAYAANYIRGCTVITSAENVRTALNLAYDQTPYIIVYDTNDVQSGAAMASVKAVTEYIGGGKVVASIYVDLFAKQEGEKIELSDGSVSMSAGLPDDADTSKDYAVICIQTGGTYTVTEDQDANPSTVTFDVQAGIGTYAFVEK